MKSKLTSTNLLHRAYREAARECIAGKHGNGLYRKYNLKNLGFSDPQIAIIQQIVNVQMEMRQQ